MASNLPRLDSRITLTDRVYEALRDSILRGDLAPGTKITESEIASQMGISITPVREAFLKLEAASLIITKPRAAAQVTMLSLDDLRQISMARAALEQAMLGSLLDNITDTDMRMVRAVWEKMGKLKQDGDWETYTQTHRVFHELLLEPAHCPLIRRMALECFDACRRYWRTVQTSSPEMWDRDHRYHGQLLDAVERKDKEAATALLRLDHREYPDLVRQGVLFEKRPFSSFFYEAAENARESHGQEPKIS
ncbi:MAG: GntR family transcriptional regulator [Chloroflexota bacterium]